MLGSGMSNRNKKPASWEATSYIVRVYRCDARGIAGMVEMPAQERQAAFRSFAELEAILTASSGNRAKDRGRRD